MPHDPEKLAEVREWLAKAEEDLVAAKILLENKVPLTSSGVFHAQQSAEKHSKASWIGTIGRFGKPTV